MEEFFFGGFGGVGAGNEAVAPVCEVSFFFQPFVQEAALFFGKFVGEADFTVTGGEDEVFAGKIQICGQCGKFSFHGFAVDLDQELVARAQGLVWFSSVCENGICALVQRQIAIYRIA